MGAALGRRDVVFDLVGKEEEADLVAVADGGEGEDARHLGRQLALALGLGAEFARRADVDGEEDGEFSFLAQLFDEGRAGARGDVPVDEPDFVARRVFAHFVEVHAAALEDGMVFAGQGVGDKPPRAQFDLAHFLQHFSGDGGVHFIDGI